MALAISVPMLPRWALRDVLIPSSAFVLALTASEWWTTAAFLVVGQAHFAMAWLYHFRAGRVTPLYLLGTALLAGGAVLYFINGGEFIPIFLVTACAFSLHFAFDEIHLHKDTITLARLFTVLSFGALFFSLVLAATLSEFEAWPIITGIIFVSGIIVRLFFSAARPTQGEKYLWFVGVLLFVFSLVFEVAVQLLAIIIVLHCINWSLDYGRRVADRNDAGKLRRYWLETFATLGLSLTLFILYTAAHVSVLQFAFVSMYYDAWALAHIALSLQLRRFSLA